MINEAKWEGIFVIKIKNKATGIVSEEIIKNRIMNVPLNALIDCLVGATPDIEIAYLAVGTNNTAITDNDSTLGTEIFRTSPVSGPARTATGQVETEFSILDSEAVATIEEIGIFVGSSATGSVDTGTLLSRILWHKVKTNSEEITFKRIDKIVRA